MNIVLGKKFSNINIKKVCKNQNKLDILLKIISNVLRKLDFLSDISKIYDIPVLNCIQNSNESLL